jgi:N6-L-threonylcarbamoyladenine synthase
VSGGHTELVRIRDWGDYEIMGRTKDDAVGEAFDKVARLLELPYPGGPEISQLAQNARDHEIEITDPLKRPMIDSGDLQFSFSGIKTAIRYRVQENAPLTQEMRMAIARDFEEACVEVLTQKSLTACKQYGSHALLVTGGVSANPWLRSYLSKKAADIPTTLFAPLALTGDNALMMALAGYQRSRYAPNLVLSDPQEIRAIGNCSIEQRRIQ